MISILVYALILILVFGVVFYVIRMLPLEEPFKTAAMLIMLIIFIVLLLGIIGIIPGWHVGTIA